MNIRKTRIIASREYFAAVQSKSFIIIHRASADLDERRSDRTKSSGRKSATQPTYHIAVMDCSPGASLYGTIADAVQWHNEHDISDASGRQVRGRFVLEQAPPVDWSDTAALDRQRLSLSDRVRAGELLAFVEIGPDGSEARQSRRR